MTLFGQSTTIKWQAWIGLLQNQQAPRSSRIGRMYRSCIISETGLPGVFTSRGIKSEYSISHLKNEVEALVHVSLNCWSAIFLHNFHQGFNVHIQVMRWCDSLFLSGIQSLLLVQIIARPAKRSGFFDDSILSSKERNRSMWNQSFKIVSWTQ